MAALFARGEAVAARLVARRETVAVAEGSAGGLIAAALLAVPGASAYFLGGGVIYTPRARHRLLGLTRDDVQGFTSATEPFAALMAAHIRRQLGADWGLAETGAAGPTGNPYGHPAGHAALAVAGAMPMAQTLETGVGDRLGNMIAFAAATLALFETALAG
ncbi:damage-inducible protein [alpha proteobacterium AAP81b]|nr:damage-inducible protein [alpha proteobacterium AAP81b]